MRDNELYRLHEAEARRVALLFSQFEFLMTLQHAYELVIQKSGFWRRIAYFLDPLELKKDVDTFQRQLIQESNQKLDEARKKAQEEKKRPRLILPSTNGRH